MKQNDLEKLKKCNSEIDLIGIVQEIDDMVNCRGYDSDQILCLVNEIIKIDLLSVKYETREEVLHLLCDIIAYYGFLDGVKWESIIKIKDKLEDDLKEYITEFMESM